MVADDERMRRIITKRLDNEALREQARRASIAASDNVWKSCLQTMPRSSTMIATGDQSNKKQDNIALTLDYWSEDEADGIASSDDNSSDERKALENTSGTPENDAVIRGWNRGSRELNESLLLPDADAPEHEFDLPTLSEAHPHHESDRRTDTASNKSRGKWTLNILRRRRSRRRINMTENNDPIKRIFYRKQQKRINNKDSTDTAECEAWMCGVCGMAFSSKLSAAKHEKDHIEQLIQYLGYSKDQQNQPMNGTNVIISPKELSERIDHRIHDATTSDLNNNMTYLEKSNDDTEFRISSNLDGLNDESESHSLPVTTSNLYDTKSKEKSQKTVAFIDSTIMALGSNEEAVLPAIPAIQRKSSLRKPTQFDDYPGLDADIPDLPLDAMIPSRSNRTRARSNSEVHFDDNNNQIFPISPSEREENYDKHDIVESQNPSDVLLLSTEMRYHVIRADEALVDVILRAEPLILTQAERAAEYELALLARDKRYYDDISARCVERHIDPTSRFRSDNKSAFGKMQNKLVDAYQLMKDSEGKGKGFYDQYSSKRKRNSGDGNSGDDSTSVLSNNEKTLYVNVMVKNSVQVVKHELQRLAKKRWESDNAEGDDKPTRISSQFEVVRGMAQTNIVKLAGLALASDFTPRRIAIQLSNDLYRLLTPRLKRRGVAIKTEIEYRVGPYFVLAINIESIDWKRLLKATYRDVENRKIRWEQMKSMEDNEEQEIDPKKSIEPKKSDIHRAKDYYKNFVIIYTKDDIFAKLFATMYQLHWIIYLPICWLLYYCGYGADVRRFCIRSVTDEIFYYVEEKGMEMEIRICNADRQASFMLSALREIRADGKELEKKQQETDSEEKGKILGPYLGPAIKADRAAAVKPPDFEVPANLEFVGLELDLPVGFQRLRWAILNLKSKFITDVFYKEEAKYERIVIGTWDKFADNIGEPILPGIVKEEDFINAEKKNEYLMPKSAFVSANMCYERMCITAYNDYCFCIKKDSRNPDAPFGNSFVAWTQITIVNTGNDTCHMTCSVEPEFPNGPPMVARQIRSGMRAGTAEVFVLLGATVTKYADEYP